MKTNYSTMKTKQPNQYTNYSILDGTSYMSQSELAKQTGIPQQTISRWLFSSKNKWVGSNLLDLNDFDAKNQLNMAKVGRLLSTSLILYVLDKGLDRKDNSHVKAFYHKLAATGIEAFIHAKCNKTLSVEQVLEPFNETVESTQSIHESNIDHVKPFSIVASDHLNGSYNNKEWR